jgi:hypothetical protein
MNNENISMNSSRPYEVKATINNENILKEMIEKNDKLEKELLKYKIQIKNLEEKIKVKNEKEYVVK